MTSKVFSILILLFCFQIVYTQKPPENDTEFEVAYQRNIKKEYLHGVYIPKDLGDAFVQLNRLIDKESKMSFKNLPEGQISDKLFFSFGRWMIHNWNFYGGSRFSNYIKKLGIFHPEDMARFVMIAYHRNLNKQSLNIKSLIENFTAKQEAAKKQLIEGGELLFEQKKVRDTTGN